MPKAIFIFNKHVLTIGISEVHKELLKLMAQGISDKEIATKHKIAQLTIKNNIILKYK